MGFLKIKLFINNKREVEYDEIFINGIHTNCVSSERKIHVTGIWKMRREGNDDGRNGL